MMNYLIFNKDDFIIKINKLQFNKVLINAISTFIFLSTFVFTYFFAPYHFGGDQIYYQLAYEKLSGTSFIEGLSLYSGIVHTAEVVHMMIVWFFSCLNVDKDVVMSFGNGLLALLFFKVLIRRGANISLSLWITYTCYYLFALYFTLERTKFALLFILAYLLTNKQLFLLIAFFTHSMFLIPFLLIYFANNFSYFYSFIYKSSKIRIYQYFKILFFCALIIIFTTFLGPHLLFKFYSYVELNPIVNYHEIIPLIFLCYFAIIFSSKKIEILFVYIFLSILVLFIGSSRLNMLGYFIFLYYMNFNNRYSIFIFIILGFYFIIKSISYLSHIFFYGS